MATGATPVAVVKRTIRVNAPIEKAFQVFTERMGSWWPATHHIAPEAFTEIIVEPRAGGRWFERDAKGNDCDWGRVLQWDKPHRLLLAWHLQGNWNYDPDPAKASEVSLEFHAEGPEATRVEFEHHHLERHGEDWEKIRTGVDAPGGWTAVLGSYVEVTNAQ